MDWVLRRLADRLGVEPARAGEAIVPRLRFEQPWSQGLTLLVVLGCAGLIVWLYRREGQASTPYKMGLAALRIVLVAAGGLHALRGGALGRADGPAVLRGHGRRLGQRAGRRPVCEPAGPRGGRRSWPRRPGTPSRPGWRSRRAGWRKTGRGSSPSSRSSTRSASTSSRRPPGRWPRWTSPRTSRRPSRSCSRSRPTGGQSRLGSGVRQVLTELRGVPPSAIVLLTDGQTTDGEGLAKAAEFAARKGVPLYTIGLGDPEPARDLELSELLVDDVVFVDDLVRFQAKLLSRGFAGQEVTVRLKERDASSSDPKSAREVQAIPVVAPPDGQPMRVEIGHRPKQTGDIIYTLEVEPRPRELQVENNRIERTVNVRKEKLKVLLVESEPRYEFRYLKNYLEREESIDLGVVLLSSDPEYSEQDRSALPTFPAAKEEPVRQRRRPDRRRRPQLPQRGADAEPRRVRHREGGRPPVHRGRELQPAQLQGDPAGAPAADRAGRGPQPVGRRRRDRRVPPRADPRGALAARSSASATTRPTSTLIWQALPELYWFLEAPRKKPAAQVLAVHPTLSGSDGKLPIVLYQFVGAGKSMFNAVDDTWRWRFRVGDRYFGRYWIQTIRFLARSKLLGQQAGRGPDRPPPLSAQPAGPGPGPVPQPRHRPDGRRGRRPGRAQGAGPAQARARRRRPARATSSKGPCRRRSRASTRSGSCPRRSSKARSPRPPSGSTRRPASWNACR